MSGPSTTRTGPAFPTALGPYTVMRFPDTLATYRPSEESSARLTGVSSRVKRPTMTRAGGASPEASMGYTLTEFPAALAT